MSDYNDGILPEPCLRMDTHFGDEYESIEFGDGTGYIKAAPILAKVGALHEEIDRLQDESGFLHECIVLNARDANAENDKLREQGERLFDKTLELATENAKLRELCKDMYEDIVYGCAECFFPKYSEHSGKPSECDNGGCGYRQIADRIRDLGVEI